MRKQKHSLLKILMVLMLLFFYLPIGFMIVFSFNSSKSLTHFTGFSMQWYSKMLADVSMMEFFICHNYSSDYCDSCFYDCWDN